MSEAKQLPGKPIGTIASLSAGLDAVIQGWWILLVPVALDLFLWFGPRLSVRPVIERLLADLGPLVGNNSLLELIQQAATEVNYFTVVSAAPLIGVPSLMAVKLPQSTPLGTPTVITVDSELAWILLFLALFLAGLLLGGVYLGLISQQVQQGRLNLRHLLTLLPRYWASVLVLLIGLVLLASILALPVIVVASVLSGLSIWIASLVIWIGFLLFLWLLFHLIFSLHGILMNRQALHTAVWVSMRLVAFNSFSVMGLVALVLGLTMGLNFLWSLPAEGSWMLLVGVVGHAVISSALLAATFVFYQDRYRYWQELRSYFQAENNHWGVSS